MVASTGLGTAVLALGVEARSKTTKQVHLPSPAWITRIGEFFRRGVAPSRSLEHWRDETSQCSGVALAERREASSRFADRGDGKGGPSNLGRRLDGTILGIRRFGNLSVPFRLSTGWGGVAQC